MSCCHDEPTCTLEQAAVLDFEPMSAIDLMPGYEFGRRASNIYNILVISTRLLQLNPTDMADALVVADPENPASALDGIIEAKAWLHGLADVLGCAEARMMIALSKRALQ